MNLPLDLVALKSFGDMLIALVSATASDGKPLPGLRLLLGSHLVPLYSATRSDVPAKVVQHSEDGVPSIYDSRKRGWLKAVASAVELRRAMGDEGSATLLFDSLGWREKFLSAGQPATQLLPAENIYSAYAETLGTRRLVAARSLKGEAVGIFPGSRLAIKNLPLALVRDIHRAIVARGLQPLLFLLEGERPDLEACDLESVIVPHDFGAMIGAVERCAAIVSADSMPAHIAELKRRPVFVFNGFENRYWLPLWSFEGRWWSLFADGTEGRLCDFLTGIHGFAE